MTQRESAAEDGERHFKASGADHGTKIAVIRENAEKYSVSAMCKVLQIPRSTYYYEVNKLNDREKENPDADVTEKIIQIFNTNRRCFGTRRIKTNLDKQGLKVFRRRIGRIMKNQNLVSTYTSLHYRAFPAQPNERNIQNSLGRAFRRERPMEVIVSDLTYVKVVGKWHYICLFIDLFNREIFGYSADPIKITILFQQRSAPSDII